MSFLDSLAFETYISTYIIQSQWIQNFVLWSEVRGHLVTSTRSKFKNNVIFGFLGPKNLYFNIHHAKLANSKFWPLIRGRRSEVIWWPLRGQNEKIMSYLDSLAQKTYISIYIMQNEWIQNFGLWSEVRGHLVTSTRSKWKNNVIFGSLDPRNLYFNIHHAKWVNSKFWPLIRG